jgi:hypothetical protein
VNRLAPRSEPEWQGLREAVAIVGMALLLVAILEVGLEWREMTRTDPTPPSVPIRTVSGFGSPISSDSLPEVVVRAVLELPTATATVPPRPTPTKAPTVVPDWCDPGVTAPGGLCQKPIPTPAPPTPYPACDDPAVEPRQWCVWDPPEGA